jgi:hypothetical protein
MPDPAPLKFAVIEIDHPHIYEQVARLLELGCECVGWFADGELLPPEGFRQQFPQLERINDRRRLLEDPASRSSSRRPFPTCVRALPSTPWRMART